MFSHLKNPSGFSKFLPEVVWHVWDGINSNSIEAVSIDYVMDPLLESFSDELIALIEIWKVLKPAVISLGEVKLVIDGAIFVVVLR